MASFQAKTGWETSRKRENKNYRSDQFQPDPDQRISKDSKKNSKNENISLQLLFKQKQAGKGRERDKNYRSDQFLPDL